MITESGGEVEEPTKNLNSFAKILDGVEPYDGNPFRGYGKRKYVQIKLNRFNVAFELFAESSINPAPADSDIGFGEDDVTKSFGVIVYDILNETDRVEDREFFGNFIPFDEFLDKYVPGEGARYSLECYMSILVDGSQLTEEFFMKMNKLWGDRGINTPGIYNTTTC